MCAILKKQVTAVEWRRNSYWQSPAGGSSGAVVLAIEGIILKFLLWSCLLMAVVFVIDLLQQVFLVADIQGLWPDNIPLIIIIPSLATVAVVLQHIGDIMHAIVGMVLLLIYAVFVLPLSLQLTLGFNMQEHPPCCFQ